MRNPKLHAITLGFMLLSISSTAQTRKKNFLLAYSDSSSGQGLWGFKTQNGKVAISPKYENVGADTLYEFAFVTLNNSWIAINQTDSVILQPFIFDNGPDYLQEGLFRFAENGKIGFANTTGKKVIPAKFDFALPFSEGLSAFVAGGKMEKGNDGHSSWNGGLWGFMNKKGVPVIKPQFTGTRDFKNKTCEVWTKHRKHVVINRKGITIRTLTW